MFDESLRFVHDDYAISGPRIWDAAQFGAATRRSRLFVIGIHKDFGEALTMEDIATFACAPTTVRAAINDLEGAVALGEQDGFDIWRIVRAGRPFDYARAARSPDGCFTGQRTTKHSKQVVKRFDKVPEGGVDLVGRHPRLAWSGKCPTLRAGTGADRGSYQSVRPIHPELPRVITVREAARLQGFPDSNRFHPTVWHSSRMIGNSVSPVMARAVFEAIGAKFEGQLPSAFGIATTVARKRQPLNLGSSSGEASSTEMSNETDRPSRSWRRLGGEWRSSGSAKRRTRRWRAV